MTDTPDATFDALSMKMQAAMADFEVRELLVNGISASRLDAAAKKLHLTASERAAVKASLIDIGLIRGLKREID